MMIIKKHAISSNHSDVRTCRQRPVFTVNISGMLLSLHINGLKQAQRFVEFFLVSVFFLRSCYSHLASACMRACVCVCETGMKYRWLYGYMPALLACD